MNNDRFYNLKDLSVEKVRDILQKARDRALVTEVQMLDCSKSFARVQTNKSFEEVVSRIDRAAAGFFTIILRRQMNVFGLLTDHLERRDILEVGIRNVMEEKVEYFLFLYLEPTFLHEIDVVER